MRVCPQCNSQFLGDAERCPIDGSLLRDQADALIGRVIGGRYRIQGRMAEGGMASIYKARHEQVERTVAVKILARMLSEDPVHKERFLREARAANRIHHENVIDITDFGETEDGLVYLVMEYLEGESLADLVTRGAVTLQRAAEILHPVCRGLQRAHDLGILHRDIKPENIFLERRTDGGETVKILDFGLAQLLGDKRLTTAGQVFGTPEYISPEQAMGGEITSRADLYAVGVVFYELMTGRLPFSGSTARLIYQHIHEAPKAPSLVRPGCPPEADEVILRLLEKEPERRYATAKELDGALRDCEQRAAARLKQSTVSTVRTAGVDAMHFPGDTVPKLRQRLAACRQAWESAGGSRDHALGSELDRVAGLIEGLGRTQATADRAEREYNDFVEHGRGTLERLRRAIDELSQDEAKTRREIEGLRTALAKTRATAGDAERDFLQARDQLAQFDQGDGSIVSSVVVFETAGKAARRWRDAAAEVEALERDLRTKTEELEEIRFQVGQFRGRVAALEVDAGAGGPTSPGAADATLHRRRVLEAQRAFGALLDEIGRSMQAIERRVPRPGG
ncbi:MAG: protein kinase [Deltaproteobacteria bacterium]|nr:protein kinase [Deltaproteobacteria bacterium]